MLCSFSDDWTEGVASSTTIEGIGEFIRRLRGVLLNVLFTTPFWSCRGP